MGAGRGVRFFVLASILWLGVVTVGCARNPNQPGDLPLRQSVELRTGSSATLEGGLTIAFDRVTSDSRCPMNAFCVWAGDAILAVSLSQGPGGPVEREFHTYPTGSDVSYLPYTIKLLVLAPYPQTDRAIPPGEYVATLEVTAR